MDRELVKARLDRLKAKSAIPAYFAFFWAAMGHWSRVEFTLRKMAAFASHPFAQIGLIVAGFCWLGWLVIRGEKEKEPGETRLKEVKRLLREAAASMRANRRDHRDFDSVHNAAYNHFNVLQFLDRAFNYRIKLDYLKFSDEEGGKWRDAGLDFPVDEATAQYLEDLANRITIDDLDFGFFLPETYEDFRKAENWRPNRRPEPRPTSLPRRSLLGIRHG